MAPRISLRRACQYLNRWTRLAPAATPLPRPYQQWQRPMPAITHKQTRGIVGGSRFPTRAPDAAPPAPPPGAPSTTADTKNSSEQAATAAQREYTNHEALKQLELISYGINQFDKEVEGHKFGLPDIPIPRNMNMKRRYEPVLDQVTKLLMQDGKLAKAQRDMAMILNYLRSQPAPRFNPNRPLLPGHPPAEHLPLDPVGYFTLAIDSVAPLVRIKHFKGMAGGGKALEVPVPLAVRQRRRLAFKWILDVVNKQQSRGSGRAQFPHRIAAEIIAVIEGHSSIWEKRQMVHKLGTANRANLNNRLVLERA